MGVCLISRGKINRAGQALRDWAKQSEAGQLPPGEPLHTLLEFRDAHIEPMLAVSTQITSILERSDSVEGFVANRLKRTPQIVAKLVRFPTTKLSQMEDIGGCRLVVLGDQTAASSLFDEVCQDVEHIRLRDYVAHPKPSGYRALHLVAQVGDQRIEIQVRTLAQQEWASAVERAAGRCGEDLKSGAGPDSLHGLLAETAELLAAYDRHLGIGDQSLERWRQLRKTNASFLDVNAEAS